MLGNLDNEVIFKKAFTDKIVFKAFVHDILGLDVEVDIIETEKQFKPKIGYVNFKLDIFAETIDKRIVIEIQKVEYDHNFDRFLHYFMMCIAEQQKSSKQYGIRQTVYLIIVMTAPYLIDQKNGQPVLNEVLLLNLNMQNLRGEIIDLYGHQFVCLNPNHPDIETPERIRDWLDLIYQSIHSPQRLTLNTNNAGIKRAIELIDFDNLTPEEREESKNKEAGRVMKAKLEHAKVLELARNGIKGGFDDESIMIFTKLSLEKIQELRKQLEKKSKN